MPPAAPAAGDGGTATGAAARVLAAVRGGLKAVPASAGLAALQKAAEASAAGGSFPPSDLARELPDLPAERLESLARRCMTTVHEADRRGLEREARKLIGLSQGPRHDELLGELVGRLIRLLAGPLATAAARESESDAAPVQPKKASTVKKRKPPRDPFADDPLAGAPALDPSQVPAVGRDPFASGKRKAPTPPAEDAPASPEAPKAAAPEAAAPLAAAAAVDPGAPDDPASAPTGPPQAEPAAAPTPTAPSGPTTVQAEDRKEAPKPRGRDPFADDPLAAAAPLDPAAVRVEGRDPFADDGDLIAPVARSTPREGAGSAPRGRRGPPPPAIKFAKKAGAPPPPAIAPEAARQEHAEPAAAARAEPRAPEGGGSEARPEAAQSPSPRRRTSAPAVSALPAPATAPPPAAAPSAAPAPEAGAGLLRSAGMAGAAAAVFLALGGAGVAVWKLYGLQQERQKLTFLELAQKRPLDEALAEAERLSPSLQREPEVEAEIKRLKARHAQQRRRTAAEQVLAQVPAAASPEERLRAAVLALATDDTFSLGYLERASLRYRQARREAPAPPRLDDLQAARQAALRDHALALEHDPRCAEARYLRARVLLEGRVEVTGGITPRGELEEVVRAAKDSPLGALAEGWIHLLEADPPGAGEAFGRGLRRAEQAARSGPVNVALEGHLGRGLARLRVGESAAALEDAEAALRLDAECAEALLLRARARLRAKQDRAGARTDLERCLELDRLSADAWALQALVLLERDRDGRALASAGLEPARKSAASATSLAKAHPVALSVLALIAAAQNRRPEALDLVDQAVAGAGPEAEPFLARGLLTEDPRRALVDLEAAVQREPDNLLALVRQAALLVEQGDCVQARARLDRALHLSPEHTRAIYYRGVVALKDRPRDLNAAVRDFDRALVLDPTLADAHLMRASAWAELAQPQKALQDLQRLDALRQHATLKLHDRWLIAGNCLYDLRQWEQAREAYRRFLDQAPADSPWLSKAKRRVEECQVRLGAAGSNREY